MPEKQEKHNQRIGRWGERIAQTYLEKQGYDLVESNARTPYGELDLIMRGNGGLIVVEVKTRTGESFGLPEVSVNSIKSTHLKKSAEAYFLEHPELGSDWRIDVIAILGRPSQPDSVQIEWFENAIS
jgi:putative endonuclease